MPKLFWQIPYLVKIIGFYVPTSPDLAYPIENLWANLKKSVKNRNPKDCDELKRFCKEEWNKIDPRNYFKNYLRKVNMVLTLDGDRIQDQHIRQIRKEEREKEEDEEEEEEEENETEIGNRKIKRVFNEVFLNNLKNKEIRSLKKKKKN